MRLGALGTLVAVWGAIAAVLWRTAVPADLTVPEPDLSHYFSGAALREHERHDRVLTLLGVGALAAELVGLALVALRAPRVRGPRLVRAAQLAALALLAAFVARLPFALAIVWWQRRSGIARIGYAQWLLDRVPSLATRAAVLAAAAALVVALAQRLGRRWWIAAAPAFLSIAIGVVLVQPLLSPRTSPLRRSELVAGIRAVGERQGLSDVRVEVRDQRTRTRALNAEALGVGPTTRIILWDTTLALPRGVVLSLSAHELAHVSRSHLWKGLGWFVLFAVPLTYALARLVDVRDPVAVPRAILVGTLLVLAITPLANAVSRRYEAEADWVALESTRDPRSAATLFVMLASASKRDPTPPRLYTFVFATHPPIAERIGMALAFRDRRAGRSPAGS